MKNSILNILFLMITFTSFSVNANSCSTNNNHSKKKYYKQCGNPVNHTNRKMNTCNKNNSCAKKHVRMNKHASRECSN